MTPPSREVLSESRDADKRIHDINVVADLNEHHPTNPSLPPPTQDPPIGNPEPTVEYDGTSKGVSDCNAGRTFTAGYEQTAQNAVVTSWEGWWPTLIITCSLVIYGLAFVMTLRVDILGSLTVSSLSLSHSALDSVSDEEMQASTDRVMGLSPVKFWSIAAMVSLTSAQFWATFGLLPYAKAMFTA